MLIAAIHNNLIGKENYSLPYFPVDIDFITLDIIGEHDIYVKNQGQFVLYRNKNLAFTEQDKKRLEENKVSNVYIFCSTEKDVQRFYENNLSTIIDSPKIEASKKAKVLKECAIGISQDVFDRPDSSENVQRSKVVVHNTIRLLAKSSKAFIDMIALSSHDYYTYTHSVNVMTFTVAVLNSMGIKDQGLLKDAALGALLHDVGKSKVPTEVLNKAGPLEKDEWEVMKQHPTMGLEILSSQSISDRGRNIVVEHHERLDGTGYPFKKEGDQIQMISQVVALCDAYDAITSNRCYQEARSPYEAFKIITEKIPAHFDRRLVEVFIHLLNIKR